MPSTREVIKIVKGAGLEVRRNPDAAGSHTAYDIVDPKTGAILTGIGVDQEKRGDPNWHWNVRRILRRAGFQIEFQERTKKKRHRTNWQHPGVIDLAALRKAQIKAEANGERIPLLEDLETNTEFFKRIKTHGGRYTTEAQEEAITIMGAENAPRMNYSRGRLEKIIAEYGDQLVEAAKEKKRAAGEKATAVSPIAEFARVAYFEVVPTRNLRNWGSYTGAEQGVRTFLKGSGVSMWAVNAMEATMDHIEGLKWGEIDETLIKEKEGVAASVDEALKHEDDIREAVESMVENAVIPMVTLETTLDESIDGIRLRYANVLLNVLEKAEPVEISEMADLLLRLDKLIGLEV